MKRLLTLPASLYSVTHLSQRPSLLIPLRFFSASSFTQKSLPPRPKPPPESDIEESYLKGSGPGGQKINKTNSAVQLKHIPTGIVVKSQATRSRSQNRKIARESLAQKVDEHLNGDQSRSAIVGGIRRQRAASAAKKSRRKYRKLEEEGEQQSSSSSTTATEGEGEVEQQPGDAASTTDHTRTSSIEKKSTTEHVT